MKQILFFFILSACSTANDNKISKYPDCFHQYRLVFDKCIELNEAGQKVNALQVEELLKKK